MGARVGGRSFSSHFVAEFIGPGSAYLDHSRGGFVQSVCVIFFTLEGPAATGKGQSAQFRPTLGRTLLAGLNLVFGRGARNRSNELYGRRDQRLHCLVRR